MAVCNVGLTCSSSRGRLLLEFVVDTCMYVVWLLRKTEAKVLSQSLNRVAWLSLNPAGQPHEGGDQPNR
jgi:hypothetical protein